MDLAKSLGPVIVCSIKEDKDDSAGTEEAK